MTSPSHKVLITTSGIGSRLGQLTEYTNKSLIVVGGKTVLARIIESYPQDTNFVITLGYFGEHVRQFLKVAYPDRNFELVEVSPYRGPGSSLALSMYQAKDFLQCPFIYHASDSILIDEKVPEPTLNWIAGQKSKDATNYASFDVQFQDITRFHEKGMVNFDYLHIGVIGIKDYLEFWLALSEALGEEESNDTLNDLTALTRMLKAGHDFRLVEVRNWLDIGNSHALQSTLEHLSGNFEVLQKSNESISIQADKVIKFFSDEITCQNRIIRARKLHPLVPEITDATRNFYSYKYVDGMTISKTRNPSTIRHLLDWAEENLWMEQHAHSNKEFDDICRKFYYEKSKERLLQLIQTRGIQDEATTINDQDVPSAAVLINQALAHLEVESKQTQIHGDFILDNILKTKDSFCLIDWRQDFGGSLVSGDQYYDLAKLKHSFHINHEIVSNNQFFVSQGTTKVECGILVKDSLMMMNDVFTKWVNEKKLNSRKIQILTSLIWLNMAPLHHHPFDQFLYYYGRLNLWRNLNDA